MSASDALEGPSDTLEVASSTTANTDTNSPGKDQNDTASIKSTEAISEVAADALDHNSPTEQELNPDLDRFMIGCQQGNLHVVKEMIESYKIKANDTFSDGITGLHWAAINNRITVVKYLIENPVSSSDPNKIGGDLMASPLHWACRNGLVYIVHYLLDHGSNPLLKDSQSYNALHLSVHSSNIMLVIYILYRFCSPDSTKNSEYQIYVDEPDISNRTSLHWACYQGDILTVQALIKFGANVNKVDDSLFIPLHWSFMKAFKPLLKLLVKERSDLFVKNDLGKDSFQIAKDMNCYSLWVKVLNECNRFEHNGWQLKPLVINESFSKKIVFATPYVLLPIVLKSLNFNHPMVLINIFVLIFIILATNYSLKNYVVANFNPERNYLKTPLSAGIFSGTFFWVVVTYLLAVFPSTIFLGFSNFLINLMLLPLLAVITYCFYKALTLNPGLVPVPTDNSKVYEQIIELINIGKFDSDYFCVSSLVRKPLRSRYSNYHKRLVARFDHFCPWVFNEIGVRNHKIFIMFTYALDLGIILWSTLQLNYFHSLEKIVESSGYESDLEDSCSILSENLCLGYKVSNFKFNLLIWCWIQFTWLSLLVVSQTFQILKGVTTYEFSHLSSNIKINHSTLPRDFIPLSNNDSGTPEPTNQNARGRNNHHHSRTNICCRLLGIDQFILTIKIAVLSLLNRNTSDEVIELSSFNNPTDYGLKQNWLDFWFLGDIKFRNIFYLPLKGENNLNGKLVDYYTLYELPPKNDIA